MELVEPDVGLPAVLRQEDFEVLLLLEDELEDAEVLCLNLPGPYLERHSLVLVRIQNFYVVEADLEETVELLELGLENQPEIS